MQLLTKCDLHRCSPSCRVTIVEAAELLSSFDSSLRNYAIDKLKKQGVQVIEKVCNILLPSLKLIVSQSDRCLANAVISNICPSTRSNYY